MAQSLAMLPIAHIACSTMPLQLDLNNLMKRGIPPLSTIDWHWPKVPEATLVSAQVAYNCSCGYYYCLVY